MNRRRRKERTEVVEAMLGHVGDALRGKLDPASAKELLIGILAAGGVVAALSLEPALLAGALGLAHAFRENDKKSVKKAKAAFQYVRDRGYIRTEERDGEVIVRMTKRGLMFAKRHTLRFLPRTIQKPRRWDNQWRLIMFDIAADERSLRNAFRTLIRRVGAVQLQKSVWVYPFDCSEQIHIFQRFFELGDTELRIVTASSIGKDSELRKYFKL